MAIKKKVPVAKPVPSKKLPTPVKKVARVQPARKAITPSEPQKKPAVKKEVNEPQRLLTAEGWKRKMMSERKGKVKKVK